MPGGGASSATLTGLASQVVRLGYYMGYAPPGTSPLALIALAQEAERLGYDSAWAAEAWGTDAVTVLSWLAATTSRIKIGSAILQMPARTPANTAMTAATLDLMSGGRFLLGLGTAGPQVVVTDDLAAGRDAIRPILGLYIGGMGARGANFYNALVRRYGYEAEAERIQELYLDGKQREAIAAVPDSLVDEVALVGPRERIAGRLEAWRESVATT